MARGNEKSKVRITTAEHLVSEFSKKVAFAKQGENYTPQAPGAQPQVEIRTPNAEDFSRLAMEAKQKSPFGASVDVKSPEEYKGYTLMMAGDGKALVSISPDGELGSVVKGPNGTANDVDAVIRAAMDSGKVKWLNAFDTILPQLYAKYGFKPVARLKFNDEYAPAGWNYDTYGKFNGGRPDVIFMARVDTKPVPYDKEVPYLDDYDEASKVARNKSTV